MDAGTRTRPGPAGNDGADVATAGASGRTRRIPWLPIGVATLLVDLVLAVVFASTVIAPAVAAGEAGGVSRLPDTINPVIYLGHAFDLEGCRTGALAFGDGKGVWCHTWSATTTPDLVMTTVTMSAAPVGDRRPYRGPLPAGLRWGQTVAETRKELGTEYKVSRMFGTPTLVYMFDDQLYGALELTFGADGGLERISATLWR